MVAAGTSGSGKDLCGITNAASPAGGSRGKGQTGVPQVGATEVGALEASRVGPRAPAGSETPAGRSRGAEPGAGGAGGGRSFLP